MMSSSSALIKLDCIRLGETMPNVLLSGVVIVSCWISESMIWAWYCILHGPTHENITASLSKHPNPMVKAQFVVHNFICTTSQKNRLTSSSEILRLTGSRGSWPALSVVSQSVIMPTISERHRCYAETGKLWWQPPKPRTDGWMLLCCSVEFKLSESSDVIWWAVW